MLKGKGKKSLDFIILVSEIKLNSITKVSSVVWIDQTSVFSYLFDAFGVFSWLPLWVSAPVQKNAFSVWAGSSYEPSIIEC